MRPVPRFRPRIVAKRYFGGKDEVHCAHRHVAAEHECDPTKHLALAQVRAESERVANAVGEPLVVGHWRNLPTDLTPERQRPGHPNLIR
jgi:hypothetical protein